MPETFYEGQVLPPKDPNSGLPSLRREGGKWVPIAAGGDAGGGGLGDLRTSKPYRDARAKGMAKADEKAQTDIDAGLQDTESNKVTLGLLQDTVKRAPTGSFAGVRESLGKNIGGWAGGLPFIPSKEEASSLSDLRTLTSERTLGDVSKLKGPLSDKDVQFLARMQVDPYGSKEHNQFVADLQTWANNRKSNYYNGMQAWMNRAGSPNAKNKDGLTYNQWWSKWSEANIPRPQTSAPSKRQQQNAALKGRSAASRPGEAFVLEVSD